MTPWCSVPSFERAEFLVDLEAKNLPAPLLDAPPKGFQRKFTATEPRLSEAVTAYQALGLEVVLVGVLNTDDCGQECSECLADTFVIYTRPGPDS